MNFNFQQITSILKVISVILHLITNDIREQRIDHMVRTHLSERGGGYIDKS